jgi:ribosomal protein S18 acetylase RimI-like enzyme
VEPDNAPARNFYEKAGFRTVELRLVVDIDTLERRLAATLPSDSS